MARGAYKSNISTRHEFYQPDRVKRNKALKYALRISAIILNVTIIAIIVSFAESKRVALASPNITEKEPIYHSTQDSVMHEYFTQVIGDEKIARLVINYSNKHDIDPTLLVALMETESSFNPKAKNHNRNGSVDRGLCQLNNKTFPDLKIKDFYDPATNIRLACELLRWCFDSADGSIEIALAYYNAGYGNVSREKVGKTTLNYIHKIIRYQEKHQKNFELLVQEKLS
ncbi:MAG: lytic transglycosylase domain-containing protein [Spirochaetes bacterium]|nr:lytic transglycosylase domain-containing protein [Spirochaetota bacterium]